MANYVYSLENDFSNKINLTCLNNTILESSINSGFNGINQEGDIIIIMYQGTLGQTASEELDLIVSIHDPDDCLDITDIGEVIGSAGDVYSNSLSSTTSKLPIKKLRMQLTSIPIATYRIGWYYEWLHSSDKSDFRARVLLDDETELMYHSQEIKEKSSQSIPVCGFAYINLSEGEHIIDIEFWTEKGTAIIQNTRLEIWRVR